MNYSGLKKYDIANGDGVRISLFVSGCENHCPGCFNPKTWDTCYGDKFTKNTLQISWVIPTYQGCPSWGETLCFM